jgi:hypothetical protein
VVVSRGCRSITQGIFSTAEIRLATNVLPYQLALAVWEVGNQHQVLQLPALLSDGSLSVPREGDGAQCFSEQIWEQLAQALVLLACHSCPPGQ